MRDAIFEAFPKTGRAGAREILADRAEDSLPTDVLQRDPEQGPVTDPMPRQPCRASNLRGPKGEPGTNSVVVTLP